MQQSRRKFIQLTGATAAGLTLTGLSGHSLFGGDTETGRIKTFGIQLYTLRDDMPNNPKEVLKQVAAFGYKQIESYEGPSGMFWGMGNTAFKSYMDDLGMKIISSHCDIEKDFQKKVDEAAAIGMKYLICPSVDAQKKIDDYKKLAEQFNQCGDICKKAGIKFAYHNHDHDFKVLDGQVAQDIYLANTDASLVDFEMDIYWVVTAKQDPEAWLKKYPHRFRFCHIKDRIKNAAERDASCILGTGSIDYGRILKTAKQNGMEYFIVEQEKYDNTTPLKSTEANAAYMKKLKT